MLLPSDFKDKISRHFYDKSVTILEKREITEPDGGIVQTTDAAKGSFLGNVRFVSQESIQNEIGLTIDADIIITCANDTEVIMDDILLYLGKRYRINNLLPSDSHLTITGKECQ